jgi:hypothetical protein
MKRIACTAAVPVFAAALAWVGGYDFDVRGFWPAWGLLSTVLVCFWVWFCPTWKG